MALFDTASNISSLDGVMVYGNVVSGGYLGIMILVMVFFISFLAMRTRLTGASGQNAKVFVASAFLTTVVSVMLFMIGGMINEIVLYLCIAATAFGVFANLMSGHSY